MEISVEKIEDIKDRYYLYDAYYVHVQNHRILTIVTYCHFTAAKWIKHSKRAYNSKSFSDTVTVALSVERQYHDDSRYGLCDAPYQLLHLCIGSHCLLYHLAHPYHYSYLSLKLLNSFLSDPKVVVVGMGIKEKASKLEKDFGVKINNAVDLNELALKRMKRGDLDLGRYDLDRLAKAVLGKHVDVVRPEKNLEWFLFAKRYCYCDELSKEKVLFTTVDVYLCLWIGSELFDMIHGNDSSAAGSSKKNKKKKEKKK